MQPLIHAEKLTITLAHGKHTLLEEASFELNKGEIVLLYGDSGSGKSTLLKLMAGMLEQSRAFTVTGSLTMAGHELIGNASFDVADHLAYVGQIPDNQIIYGSVEDEIAFPLENAATDRERMQEKIERFCKLFNLDAHADTLTLSGGQKERLCIASALATQKKVLLLDEPLASLDKSAAKTLLSALQQLALEGYAIVIADHRLSTLKDVVDSCYEIQDKHLIKRTPQEIAAKTAEFVDSYTTLLQRDFVRTADQSKLLSLKNIQITKHKRKILAIDALDIYAGDVILLMGDNGAGKTTLLQVLASIIKIKRPGKRVCSCNVCMLWQNPDYQLFAPTVTEELSLRAELDEATLDLLKSLRLESTLDQHPLSLSEGQKRRLIFAASLAANPDVLVLDEPFQGQDAAAIAMQIDKLIAWQRTKDAAIIISTHDIRGLMPYINRVLWMQEGNVSFDSANASLTDEALPSA